MTSVWKFFKDFGREFARSPISWVTLTFGMGVGVLIRLPLVPWHLDGPAATIFGAGIGAALAVSGAAWVSQNRASNDERYARNQLRIFVEIATKFAVGIREWESVSTVIATGDVVAPNKTLMNDIRWISRGAEQQLAQLRGVERMIDKMRPTLSPTLEDVRHALSGFNQNLQITLGLGTSIAPTIPSHMQMQQQVKTALDALERSMHEAAKSIRRDEFMYEKTSEVELETLMEEAKEEKPEY